MTTLLTTSKKERLGLIRGFVESMERFRSRPALHVEGTCLSYESLNQIAGNIAATIREIDHPSNPLIALLAHRSLTAYAGVLGILGAGKGYVPLNPKLPPERLLRIIWQSKTKVLIVDRETWKTLPALLAKLTEPVTVICPELEHMDRVPSLHVHHRFVFSNSMARGELLTPTPQHDRDSIAYLLFTSGSTGDPKGVPVRHGNVKPYIRYISERYAVNQYDRFSQMFDLSFDLSVHDMFVCWEGGACLYVVPEHAVMAPAKFIRYHQITMWFSVPSVVGVMSRLHMLKPGCFPSLRGSLFCGEPLHHTYAKVWQEAAPNSFVDNLYGPTETTIAITHYRWDAEKSPMVCESGIVPIGWPFDGQNVCVVDVDLRPVEAGASGELCVSGSQVTDGYWNNPPKTAKQFVRLLAFGEKRWYRTGDLVRQDDSGCLHYLGRIDNQVKIRGHRVELQEVDFVLRKAAETEQVASVAWPINQGIAEGIVSFICGLPDQDVGQLLRRCRDALPEYMVPRKIYCIDDLPLNVHGKTDRLKLLQLLEGELNDDHTGREAHSNHQGVDPANPTAD